jgi:glycosyltransferase involved in cell wall biosynthesis
MWKSTLVIPTYNGSAVLSDLTASIADQVADDYRILFVDDASTDKTVALIESTRLQNARIVRNRANAGLYGSLNVAAHLVDTEYMTLLFQDDWVEPDYFRCMKMLSEKYPEASIIWSEINTSSAPGMNPLSVGITSGREILHEPCVAEWRSALLRGTFWTISGSTLRTDFVRRLGFREDLPHCADFDFLLRALRMECLLYFQYPLVNIRIHEQSAGSRNLRKSADLRERINVLQENLERWPKDVDLSLKLLLMRRLGKQIVRRAAGQLRRGNSGQAFGTLGLLLSAYGATIGKRALKTPKRS